MPLSVWLLMTALLVALGSGALPQLMFGALLAVLVTGLATCAGATLASDPSRARGLFNWLAKGLLAAGGHQRIAGVASVLRAGGSIGAVDYCAGCGPGVWQPEATQSVLHR